VETIPCSASSNATSFASRIPSTSFHALISGLMSAMIGSVR
jgi:hypothetical protein